MSKSKLLWIILFISFQSPVQSQYNDYAYRFFGPSFSNYGTIGIVNAPSARFHPGGTLGFTWSHNQPYLRGSVIAYPFDWFEASYQYADINNYLYSQYKEFSGGQSFKDKSFDAKFRITKEGDRIPAIAVGFRDLAGTGIFAGEYVVANKAFRNLDISIGLGWGALSGGTEITNPLIKLSDRFRSRTLVEGGEGGEFSNDTFFSGPAAIFWGIEYTLPFLHGATIAAEYDPINYQIEGIRKLEKPDSRFNIALKYPITDAIRLRLGVTRGNTLNFAFSYNKNFGSRDPFNIKNDPPDVVPYSEVVKELTSADVERAYKALLLYLRERDIKLQSAQIRGDVLAITYAQNTYFEKMRGLGRALRVADQVAPNYINNFEFTQTNADIALFTADVPRESFSRYRDQKMHEPLLRDITINRTSNPRKDHEFAPTVIWPVIVNSPIEPSLQNQIGGPDGFWFGQLDVKAESEILFSRASNISGGIAYNVWNNYADLKLESSSILPHVRTDVNRYLRASINSPYINNLQANYFFNPAGDLYGKFSAGLLERMFGGYGFELLYKPFDSLWGVGIEAWRVKQRDYEMQFSFLDYETTTGHLSFYLREPKTGLFLNLSGGRFLAEDSGISVDISKQFKSGMNIGAFFSLTDISKAEFGEGSFDKGIYFNLPLQIFNKDYRTDQTGFSIRPLTRDGAARIKHNFGLWSITTSASRWKLYKDLETIYE